MRGRSADDPRYRQAKETKRGETTVRKSQHPIVLFEAGEPPRGTLWRKGGANSRHLWRERSEANCLTSGCKSRRRRSPCGAVVISGSPRGDPRTGSPEVKALDGQVGTEPLWSGQHRGQATRRAVTKVNGLNAEIGCRTKLIQAEYWRCQEFFPSIRWPVPMRKDGAVPVSDLPAEFEGGNPGKPSS